MVKKWKTKSRKTLQNKHSRTESALYCALKNLSDLISNFEKTTFLFSGQEFVSVTPPKPYKIETQTLLQVLMRSIKNCNADIRPLPVDRKWSKKISISSIFQLKKRLNYNLSLDIFEENWKRSTDFWMRNKMRFRFYYTSFSIEFVVVKNSIFYQDLINPIFL